VNAASRFLVLALLVLPAGASPSRTTGPVPDLRKTIDFERKGEFNLGPTGALGWIFTGRNFMTDRARQILVTKVEPGSPAEGVLKPGDVILGTYGKPFDEDARSTRPKPRAAAVH